MPVDSTGLMYLNYDSSTVNDRHTVNILNLLCVTYFQFSCLFLSVRPMCGLRIRLQTGVDPLQMRSAKTALKVNRF